MSARKTILLVDDDEAVLEYLTVKLGAEFDLLPTGSPEEALVLARDRQPDLVLCDIDLPGMDGGDLSAALFAQPETHAIPLLFLTALVTPRSFGCAGGNGRMGFYTYERSWFSCSHVRQLLRGGIQFDKMYESARDVY